MGTIFKGQWPILNNGVKLSGQNAGRIYQGSNQVWGSTYTPTPPAFDMPTTGLLWWYDSNNTDSYPGSGGSVYNLSTDVNTSGDTLALFPGGSPPTLVDDGGVNVFQCSTLQTISAGGLTATGSATGNKDLTIVQIARHRSSSPSQFSTFLFGNSGFAQGFTGWNLNSANRIGFDMFGNGPTYGAGSKVWSTTSGEHNLVILRRRGGEDFIQTNVSFVYPDGAGSLLFYTGSGGSYPIDVLQTQANDTPNLPSISISMNGYNTVAGGGANANVAVFAAYDRYITDTECQEILDYYENEGFTLV